MKGIIKKTGKAGKHVLLIYPIRILIIINSILFPLLLGVLIFLVIHYAQPVVEIFDKAKQIEDIILKNIHLGVNVITTFIGNNATLFTDPTIMSTFVKDNFIPLLLKYMNHNIDQDQINDIKNAITDDAIRKFSFNNVLDMAGHPVKDLITPKLEEALLTGNIITKKQINKLLKEDRSIAYVITHSVLNG
tara:strand:+ start:1388 stop:1957 length:570 start_codon:yes stop_codon:yes gene_type:complete